MTGDRKLKIGGLLLAAGGSSRMGRPKQLVEFEGTSLIRIAARALTASGCNPLVAVVGAEIDRSTREIEDLPLQITVNDEWQSGISTSLRSGVRSLLVIDADLDGILITLCDQPLVNGGHLAEMLQRFGRTDAHVVAARYDGRPGVPALFSAKFFDRLMLLNGDQGARQLIRDSDDVECLDLPEAAADIDWAADIEIVAWAKSERPEI
jgi:molybdenum cofactor cytidylyltransferase